MGAVNNQVEATLGGVSLFINADAGRKRKEGVSVTCMCDVVVENNLLFICGC